MFTDQAEPQLPQGRIDRKTYLSSLFPDISFKLLSSRGASALVYDGNDGRVYKVMNDNKNYGNILDEAAAGMLLSQEGLAPTVHLLVPAQNPIDSPTYKRQFTEFDAAVPTAPSAQEYATIVSDKIDFDPDGISKMTDNELITEFHRLAEALAKHGIYFNDTELVRERKSGKLMMLDVGACGKFNPDNRYAFTLEGQVDKNMDLFPGCSDDEVYRAKLYRGLLNRLTRSHKELSRYSEREIAELIKNNNIKKIHELIIKKDSPGFTDLTKLMLSRLRSRINQIKPATSIQQPPLPSPAR